MMEQVFHGDHVMSDIVDDLDTSDCYKTKSTTEAPAVCTLVSMATEAIHAATIRYKHHLF